MESIERLGTVWQAPHWDEDEPSEHRKVAEIELAAGRHDGAAKCGVKVRVSPASVAEHANPEAVWSRGIDAFDETLPQPRVLT